jgi:hypothetical protein
VDRRDVTVFDLDDFCQPNHELELLDLLADRTPGFKVTLFSIPYPVTPEFVRAGNTVPTLKAIEQWFAWVRMSRTYIELALHGWHHTFKECGSWTKRAAIEALVWAEATGLFVKGFKAPYWEISPPVYEALLERGWWVADHERNRAMRPPGLRVYEIDNGRKVHGHIQNIGSNGLREAWDVYARLRGPFGWVSEEMT